MYQLRKFLLLPIFFYAVFAVAERSDITGTDTAPDALVTGNLHESISLAEADIPMVMVSGGCFKPGSQIPAYDGGKLRQLICVNQFEIGQVEVTQQLWQAVMGNNPSFFADCGPDCPVERVSWNDVHRFIDKLNRMTASNFRLPTEAEWEYACRSDIHDSQYCGGNLAVNVGWFSANSGGKTYPGGQKQANSLGIYDMSGNVWEWVQNRYDDSTKDAAKLASGIRDHSYPVLRGGSWRFNASSMESTDRGYRTNPSDLTYDIGFRLARSR